MFDRFKRTVDYLRISVTDRCNLRCRYCMPEEGIHLLRHEDILSFDEITGFTRAAVSKGVRKIRITGGEPLARKGIVNLVSMIASIGGIDDFAMTTNGTLLRQSAYDLAKAGLNRVNVSLDTTDSEKYTYITRRGRLEDAFSGIEAALEAGLTPVKINCVIRESAGEPDAKGVAAFCLKNGLEVRYIHEMNLVRGFYTTVEGGSGGDCPSCNRLRLTSDGKLKPCLFSDIEYDIRKIGYDDAIDLAVEAKPERGSKNHKNGFYNIGG